MSDPRPMPAAGVSATADKRFRRAETRPGRRKGPSLRAKIGVWLAMLTVLLALLAAGVTKFMHLSAFTIDRIAVHGNARLSAGEVIALVDGIRGENMFAADLARYRGKVLESPWVADVTMRRVLPSTIDMRVVERVPMALARQGDALFLIDASGVVIDEYGPQYVQYDLPIVDGLVPAASPSTPGAPAAGVQERMDGDRVRLAARFLDALNGVPAIRPHVSQIDVTDLHNLVVLLDKDPVALRLGDRDFAARLQRYVELAPALKQQITDVDAVDLRFDGNIPVSRRPAATLASGAIADAAKGKH